MPKFRMIHVDHYMNQPIAPFDDLISEVTGKPTNKVPIIRIFGADEKGRKICIHVHGFYPYVAIQNPDPNDSSISKRLNADVERGLKEEVEASRNKHRQRVETSINPNFNELELLNQDTDSNLEHRLMKERQPLVYLTGDQKSPIHRIEPIKTFNYYGYHHVVEDFLKIYLYNPKMVKQLALLFQDYKIFNQFVPVFWAHLPYILLFFIDNNLRGLQFIEVDRLYWRKDKAPKHHMNSSFAEQPQASSSSMLVNEQKNQANIVESYTSEEESMSTCELEADIRFEWIVNRQKFGSKGNDDALKELWLDDQESTQSSSYFDQKLPIFSLERNYLEQLCDSYNIDYRNLDLELVERPIQQEQPLAIDYHCSDSDISLEAFRDSEYHNKDSSPESLFVQPINQEESSSSVIEVSKATYGEEDFSDDDDDFLRNVVKIEAVLKTKANQSEQSIVNSTSTPVVDKVEKQSSVKDDTRPRKVKLEQSNQQIASKIKQEELSDDFFESDFSDDDMLLMEAVKKVETQIQEVKKRKHYSDNSLIDGRSVVCSTINQTRSNSQRSSSSTRETVSHEYQHLCLMSMELHVSTREKLRPNPSFDPIEAVFYCIRNDVPETSETPGQVLGMLITDPFRLDDDQAAWSSVDPLRSPGARSNMSTIQKVRTLLHKTGLSLREIELNIVDTELELIIMLVEVVKAHDPEILLGYEMEYLSWGYVLERATKLNVSISVALSRIVENKFGHNSKYVESTFVQPVMFTGRMVFSTWRIVRHDIHLSTCSYERLHHHALNERVPCFSFETLTKWFNQNRNRWRVIDYYFLRVAGQMRILDKFDLIAKVSELARVYGTQFIDVITRGSQIGIESMMLRLAKLQNFTPLSPTVIQRNKMKAPEALPLVMEPESNIYYDPVAVLDFQSLYPSVVIAYNYCYSTCLGRVTDLESKEKHQFGCSMLKIDEVEIKRLLETNSIHVSPCGVAFVKKPVRHGILPKMLSELITTRAMVKDQMKKNIKSDCPNRRLQRLLDHRQHGLKMMANTTYGYTAASYTGRMPCVEIADSIVSKGRETLENAIQIVESKSEWGAKVIYGDTDSIFIQFPDCDKETAFKRAYEMVEAISAANPYPIKMKFEKIYQPCVLQTKKRYCGFKYEYPEQEKPEFEAKGIETVRRDCCPAAAKMLEMSLRIQFTTRNIEKVKEYVQHQFIKIMSGKLSNIQDFIFARQYKPRDLDKSESVFVPAWQITKRLLATDPRAEPRLNERVPFVIIYGEPRVPLVNLAKTPMEVLENLSYRINADYYIQKIICPTLNRIFCTQKVDTLLWYKSMPHQNIIHRSHYLVAQKNQYCVNQGGPKQSTMSQYFSPSQCPVCAKSIPVSDEICGSCRGKLQASVIRLTEEISRNQKKLFVHHQICRACSSLERSTDVTDDHYNPCISYDCENLFRYHQAKLDALNSNYLSQTLRNLT